MSWPIEEWVRGRVAWYICGIPGNYAIKSCGNNRIIVRDLKTLEDARAWLVDNRAARPYNTLTLKHKEQQNGKYVLL